ncbi:MAG: adenosylcobalamin-dependent ribonucleoside-diphosphate reductase [Methanotrichaceae archaeon]|nr:adenosylcobalamin-dependent ribonucleoside-diphosphate reductase [Methanotrichaceae archaeon]
MESIVKRDGRVVPFDPQRISRAIGKAFESQGIVDPDAAEALAERVVRVAEDRLDEIPTVEEIQDIVEEVLIDAGYAQVAKAYILYRQRRGEIRGAKKYIGVADDLKLSVNAIEVLRGRYLRRDVAGNVIETPGEMFARVARVVSTAEKRFGGDKGAVEKSFLHAMKDLLFLPNSPTLMNAGLPLGQLSACFVLPVEDSISGIFNALKWMALVHQSGGGTGFGFSRLRPKGDAVASTGGVASGPVSFMRIFDAATDVIKQGGRRRGANMAILRADHPDILEFIAAKEQPGHLENFNLSVAASDHFMKIAREGGNLDLVNPRSGEIAKSIEASELLRLIATSAWRGGDPGLIFIDRINATHPIPGTIEATNPCGEQPLLSHESCNLGSINLSRVVKGGGVDWDLLAGIVRLGVRFLDDVIEVNRFPLPQIRKATLRSRKIGLGVMGFAEMLIMLGISYASKDALKAAEDVMGFINGTAREESERLGLERGSFPAFEESSYARAAAMRNATVTTVAPTGTISIIAGTSSGIEPLFAISFVRHVLGGARLIEGNHLFEEEARRRGIYGQDLMAEVARRGTLREIRGIPKDMLDLFITALEIDPEQHVKVQAAFQRHTDNAVSKTVNLPNSASAGDVLRIYDLAYRLGCKGVTVYRYGSRGQVLYLGDGEGEECRCCNG